MTAAPFHKGAIARLRSLDAEPGGFAVVLAVPPAEPSIGAVLRSGAVSACVMHDRGMTWPDLVGQRLVRATLEQGGTALLAFESLGDAAACTLRLRREGVR